MKTKKIALVGNTSWSMLRFRKHVIEHFLNQGIEVFVFAPRDSHSSQLVDLGCQHKSLILSRKGLNPFIDLLTLINLCLYYWIYRPDFVFHYTIKPNIWGGIAARFVNIRAVAITTGLGYVFIGDNLLTKFVTFLYRVSLKFCEAVCFLNEDDQAVFVSRKIIPENKTQILPGEGIDLDEFEFESTYPDVPTFLMISRLLLDKGVMEYIQAAEIVKKDFPNARFQLLGPLDPNNPSAVSYDTVKNWESVGLIKYLGTLDDVRPVLANCTAVVLPSYREGVPRVLLEGGAMGRVLITTNAPGCRSVVSGMNDGLRVEVKSISQLAEAMLSVCLLSKASLATYGKEVRKRIENNFSIRQVISKYDSLITQIESTSIGTQK